MSFPNSPATIKRELEKSFASLPREIGKRVKQFYKSKTDVYGNLNVALPSYDEAREEIEDLAKDIDGPELNINILGNLDIAAGAMVTAGMSLTEACMKMVSMGMFNKENIGKYPPIDNFFFRGFSELRTKAQYVRGPICHVYYAYVISITSFETFSTIIGYCAKRNYEGKPVTSAEFVEMAELVALNPNQPIEWILETA